MIQRFDLPVVRNLLAHLVRVIHHLGFLIKHDARRLHDELDPARGVLHGLDLDDVVPRQVLERGDSSVESGEGLIQVSLKTNDVSFLLYTLSVFILNQFTQCGLPILCQI